MNQRAFSHFSHNIIVAAVMALASPASAQVIVWGDDSYGATNVPSNATNIIAISGGDYDCLAIQSGGSVVGWGSPSPPNGLSNIVAIAGGDGHALALSNNGGLTQWGFNEYAFPAIPTNIIELAQGPGAQHTLVLLSNGTVADWGNSTTALTPIPATAVNIVDIASGAFYALAVRSDGTVVAWGQGGVGQTEVPANATNVVAVAAGWYSSAALRADGSVISWGQIATIPSRNTLTNMVGLAIPFNSLYGEPYLMCLSRGGSLTLFPTNGTPPYPTPTNHNLVAVSAGSYDGIALIGAGPPVFAGNPANRTVSAGYTAYFHANAVGALPLFYQWTSNGVVIPGATNPVLALTNVQLSLAGSYYNLIASNTLGSATNGTMFLNVTPLELYTQTSASNAVVDETVSFTGSTIGKGPFTYQWEFDGTNIGGQTNLNLTLTNVGLAASGTYSIVVSNGFGALTNQMSLLVTPTITTNPLQNLIAFENGTADFSIGLQSLIPVTYQWESNGTSVAGATNTSYILSNVQPAAAGSYGVVFSDQFETVTNNASLSIVDVASWGDMGLQTETPSLSNVIAIATGSSHGLALNPDGTVTGWGDNTYGEAVAPAGLTNVIAVAAGDLSSMALLANGTVVAWGDDNASQTNVPVGLSNVVSIAAGLYDDLALLSDGTVVAWGDNTYGETNLAPGLTNVVEIAANDWSCMALLANGSVVAWGVGTNGSGGPNYGQGVLPADLTNVVQVAVGGYDNLALKSDGTIEGWGLNSGGSDSQPASLSNVVAIAAGVMTSVALSANGEVTAWGYNTDGDTQPPAGLVNVSAIASTGYHMVALVGTPPLTQVPLSNPVASANGFSLSLPSQSGRVYSLEFKNSLSDASWTMLPLVAGTGSNLSLTDPSPNITQRFYRVCRW